MSYFNAKMHQIGFRLGLWADPTGELTAFHRPLSWIYGEENGGKGSRGDDRGGEKKAEPLR